MNVCLSEWGTENGFYGDLLKTPKEELGIGICRRFYFLFKMFLKHVYGRMATTTTHGDLVWVS